MDTSKLSVQRYLQAACIECEQTQTFRMTDGNGDEGVAHFNCDECGHTIVVALDP